MNVPILNIESIGCKDFRYDTNRVFVQYIPSLTYIKHGLFSTSEHTIYLPIIFDKEEQIKELFEHYNDLTFKIAFSKYSGQTYSKYLEQTYSKNFNLLDIANLKKICKDYSESYREFNIEYIIRYRGFNN